MTSVEVFAKVGFRTFVSQCFLRPHFLASSFALVCLGCQFGQTSFQVLLVVPTIVNKPFIIISFGLLSLVDREKGT